MKILYYSAPNPLLIPAIVSTPKGEILTIKEVADYLKVTERTIYRLAGAKKIPAFKVGGGMAILAQRHRYLDRAAVDGRTRTYHAGDAPQGGA